MVTLAAYKVVHILGVLFLFTALGSLLAAAWPGGNTAAVAGGAGPLRRRAGLTHGFALVLVLLSGFGMLARLGSSHPGVWGLWVWLKLLTWLLLGAALTLIRRQPRWAPALWLLLPVLGGLAAYLALYKPDF
jgi:hypothetical protein